MREVSIPAQIVKVLDTDDADLVLAALQDFIRKPGQDEAMSDRAWAIRSAIKAALSSPNMSVRVEREVTA